LAVTTLREHTLGDSSRDRFALPNLPRQIRDAQTIHSHRNNNGHEGKRCQHFNESEGRPRPVSAAPSGDG
jgi:hypothetical protein